MTSALGQKLPQPVLQDQGCPFPVGAPIFLVMLGLTVRKRKASSGRPPPSCQP